MVQKTHWKKTIDTDWIGAYVLPEGKPIVVEIEKVQFQQVKVKSEKENHAVAYFKPNQWFNKPMLLNSTNMKALEKLTKSPYLEDWKDLHVTLEQKWVKAFGDADWALRISTIPPKISLPSLTESDKNWDSVVKYYKEGKVDMKYIESKYTLTKEIKDKIEKYGQGATVEKEKGK